jgi:hypothetical protein
MAAAGERCECVLTLHCVGNDRGDSSMLMIKSQSRSQALALMEWREAADLVSSRWRTYLDAEPASRPLLFASYLSALDAEEAAAADMAALHLRAAA